MSTQQGPEIRSLRAIAHPLRLRMLSLLTGAEMSAAEVARELGITHANASYHLRRLHEAGSLSVTGSERIRGGLAKRYRYVVPEQRPVEASRRGLPVDGLIAYLRANATEVERRARSFAPGTRSVSSDLEAWVEERDWAEALALLDRASHLLHRAARPPRSPGTRHVSSTITAFQVADS